MPPNAETTELDAIHEHSVRIHVAALNEAVRKAQRDGLHVNLGITRYGGEPSHTEVNVAVIERPWKWAKGGTLG